ncbi:MAG: metallophosphoesterase [Oligoflexales bacterium]
MTRLSFSNILIFFFVFLIFFCTQSRYRWTTNLVLGDRFLTVKTIESEPLRFFILGDTGSGNEDQLAVARAMERRCQDLGGLDGLFLLGDNFYMRGVSSVDDPQWEGKIRTPYRSTPCLAKTPIYPILGNHDIRENPEAQILYSQIDPKWKMPARFYAVDFDSRFRVIAFDSSYPDMCLSSRYCSVDFLLSMVNLPFPGRKVVMSHHPLTSASTLSFSHSGGWLGKFLKPWVCHQIDGWWNGHSHHMELRRTPHCSSDFIVSGAGGGTLEPVKNSEYSEYIGNEYGYLELEVSVENELFYHFHGLQQEFLYSWKR